MTEKICSVPGRVCLFGDHMDWLGKTVITSAINRRIFCRAKKNNSRSCDVYSYPPFTTYTNICIDNITINYDSDFKYVEAVLSVLKKKFDIHEGVDFEFFKPDNRDMEYLPGKMGLSSSAALCVATVAAYFMQTNMLTSLEKNLNNKSILAEIAFIAERDILGINCGRMDPYACAIGGLLQINCEKDNFGFSKFRNIPNLCMVLGDSGKRKDTERILGWLKNRYEEEDHLLLHGISEISKVVKDAICVLIQPDVDVIKLGDLMDKNQHFIRNNLLTSGDCPISPSNLDELVKASKKAGAIGAKVTGSGGGGCIIALCNSKNADTVIKAIFDSGGTAYEVFSSEDGIKFY